MERIASHDGLVETTRQGHVTVSIDSTSACAACEAHSKCGFAESKTKTMEIATPHWADFHQGDTVKVNIDESRGLLAVWIAYVLPAILMLATIILLSLAGLPEWGVILLTLGLLGLYILGLYLLRSRINNRFTLTLERC